MSTCLGEVNFVRMKTLSLCTAIATIFAAQQVLQYCLYLSNSAPSLLRLILTSFSHRCSIRATTVGTCVGHTTQLITSAADDAFMPATNLARKPSHKIQRCTRDRKRADSLSGCQGHQCGRGTPFARFVVSMGGRGLSAARLDAFRSAGTMRKQSL